MSMTGTMRSLGSAARYRAEAASHRVKDRMLEKRLDRAATEAERLRLENEMLRDEVESSRTEHHRILDLLEERTQAEENGERRSHKGRWMLILLALGGGAYAVFRRVRSSDEEWAGGRSEGLASGTAA